MTLQRGPMEIIELKVEAEFEECLELRWWIAVKSKETLVDSNLEMVIDRSAGTGPCKPHKDAMVKRMPMGKETNGCLQGMPDSRSFLISVAGRLGDGTQVRSPWVRAATLNPKEREMVGNLDPTNAPRMGCKLCPCLGYVPQKWDLNSKDKMRCRCCGCGYMDHLLVEIEEILKAKLEKLTKKIKKKGDLVKLPNEAVGWDERECMLWLMSDGQFHPRETVGSHRKPLSEAAKAHPGGPHGTAGKKGRVSVITPTIESRQKFHRALWECFEAQEWEDKELVVVETYYDQPSKFLAQKAEADPRLIYVSYKRPRGCDWSIGLKRNICGHLSTGELIANFDDDDLYAPSYLTTMAPLLRDRSAHAVTLSSWYIYETKASKWGFCDAIAWGWQRGMDGDAQDVKNWAYGYGFSYVHRRQDLMDMPYDDINMGEDYGFVSKLLRRSGDKSVYLFHDEFGICLHTQHGENTSNAFPVRTVGYEEAGDLDVADLPPEVVSTFLDRVEKAERTQGRGLRMLTAHMLQGDVQVCCTAGATVEDFLRRLAFETGGASQEHWKVFRVPVLDMPTEAGQGSDQWLADLLGFQLEESFVEDVTEGAAERVRAQKERMMAQARRPMHIRDRICLRLRQLWVVPASMVEDADEDIDLGEDRESFSVEVTVQKTDAKHAGSVGNTIKARVAVGSTVAALRWLFGPDLPKRARILVTKHGKGLMPLSDDDPLPERVTITEFKGTSPFYMIFSVRQCASALTMMKRALSKKSMQQQLDNMQEAVRQAHPAEDDRQIQYRAKLSTFLLSEIYPPILRYFGLPEGSRGLRFFMNALALVTTELSLTKLWLEVETLMRNETNIKQARDAIAKKQGEQ